MKYNYIIAVTHGYDVLDLCSIFIPANSDIKFLVAHTSILTIVHKPIAKGHQRWYQYYHDKTDKYFKNILYKNNFNN